MISRQFKFGYGYEVAGEGVVDFDQNIRDGVSRMRGPFERVAKVGMPVYEYLVLYGGNATSLPEARLDGVWQLSCLVSFLGRPIACNFQKWFSLRGGQQQIELVNWVFLETMSQVLYIGSPEKYSISKLHSLGKMNFKCPEMGVKQVVQVVLEARRCTELKSAAVEAKFRFKKMLSASHAVHKATASPTKSELWFCRQGRRSLNTCQRPSSASVGLNQPKLARTAENSILTVIAAKTGKLYLKPVQRARLGISDLRGTNMLVVGRPAAPLSEGVVEDSERHLGLLILDARAFDREQCPRKRFPDGFKVDGAVAPQNPVAVVDVAAVWPWYAESTRGN
ncbi:hypothetical protein K438DRAFT_1766460 [Mycena galopus ATCC 62051]|nr:hypothetical protein K438DRAFT_1766460 [Mycena galopus ATCC 62051]